MGFSKEEWEVALGRIRGCSDELGVDVSVLMTRNTGAETDIEASAKEKSCFGKVMLRTIPADVDEVIETRIAVVGNGAFLHFCQWDMRV